MALALVAALGGAAITWVVGAQGRGSGSSSPPGGGPSSQGADRPVVRTTLPGLATPTGEPMLPSLARVHPAPGEVVLAEGPFDDRFTLARPRLDRARVTGVVTITSDVSDLLALQVLVGFYDGSGRLLGTGRYIHTADEDHHSQEGVPSEVTRFSVPVPDALRSRVAAAAVGVPVLVNE